MNLFKPHFWYNKRQRNGVLFLVSIILILQFVYFYVDFSSDKIINTNSSEISYFQKQIDSLKIIALENIKPKIFPFNPNYITDFKGGKLGMSIQEMDRLHEYRKQRKFVNSVKEFQQITRISDSLLNEISPYFKFPDWVVKRNKLLAKNKKVTSFSSSNFSNVSFSTEISSEIEKSIIKKININTASFKAILKIPNIDYELCKKIFEYRDEVAELQDISEIKNIDNFPIDKYDRIVLYLKAE
ncbi:ComEA family DNA-binding protein [Tenacibaculum salmonis]|uniref:ComEA family DNA-binding protein n=1 Tax=Tenacibaculum sp. P3-BQ1 TaxID=3232310 RepID=UPI0034DE5042